MGGEEWTSEKENATTDNCKLNFDIQIHMYSMYMYHEEIHAQKWDMYKHLPYSAKFSRPIIFAVFADRPPSAKMVLREKHFPQNLDMVTLSSLPLPKAPI